MGQLGVVQSWIARLRAGEVFATQKSPLLKRDIKFDDFCFLPPFLEVNFLKVMFRGENI